MKKTFYLLLFIFSLGKIYSQNNDYTVRVKVDNTYQNAYDKAYNEARLKSMNKEIADMIRNQADVYFTKLNRTIDFLKSKNQYSSDMDNEINRLRNYGNEILNSIDLLETSEFTPSKMDYIVRKAFDELNYSSTNQSGTLRIIMQRNIFIQLIDKMPDDDLYKIISHNTGKSNADIIISCNGGDIHKCLVMLSLPIIENIP